MAALFRRNLVVSPRCFRCGTADETVEHLCFEYDTSKLIWHCSPLGFNFEIGNKVTFAKWLSEWFSIAPDNSTTVRVMSIIILWKIWIARNNFMWNDMVINPIQVSNQAKLMFHEPTNLYSKVNHHIVRM